MICYFFIIAGSYPDDIGARRQVAYLEGLRVGEHGKLAAVHIHDHYICDVAVSASPRCVSPSLWPCAPRGRRFLPAEP